MKHLLMGAVLFFGGTFCVAAEEATVNFSDPMFARLDADGERLLLEYAEAYPKIKGFYENLRMDADTVELYNPSEEELQARKLSLEESKVDKSRIEEKINQWRSGAVRTERQYSVRHRADGYARVDFQMNHSDGEVTISPWPLPESLVHIPTVRMTLCTPVMNYELSKSGNPSKTYFTLNAKRSTKSPHADDIGIPLVYFDHAPFCKDGVPLEEVFFQNQPLVGGKSQSVVEYVRQEEVDGTQVVKIRRSLSDPKFIHVFGEIELYKDSWGIKETYSRYQVISQDGHLGEIRWAREKCTYDSVVDGVPLLKTYHRSFGTYDPKIQKETLQQQTQYEITNLISGPPDLSEFDVAQFLPPNTKVGEVTLTSLSFVRIAAVVIGIILIVFGIYMKIKNSKYLSQ